VSFKTQITVAFGETDPAGLVYFPNILHYCHLAMERFFSERYQVDYSSLIRDQQLGFPTVKITAEFLTPIVYGDTVIVELTTIDIGNSSVTFKYLVQRWSDQVLCARLEQVHVAMNLATKRPVLIPSDLRQVLEDNR
jgi:4-hydroxybenzoyl-CoA thioesterase